MPQTSDELRDLMARWFGPHSHDAGPYALLISHGFLDTNGFLSPPVEDYTISMVEWYCIQYLIEEWDYALAPRKFDYLENKP